VLPNTFKDNKVSISERVTFLCGFPLRFSFVVCRISGVLLISAFKRRFGGGFWFIQCRINIICAHGQTHNNISSIHTILDRQAGRTCDMTSQEKMIFSWTNICLKQQINFW